MLTDRELQTMRNLGGFSEEAADEITSLREQLHLAEVARAAQVEGLTQGAAGWRERSEQLAAEVAGLREALELIAMPMRPDGTWNRERLACQQLAFRALHKDADASKQEAS